MKYSTQNLMQENLDSEKAVGVGVVLGENWFENIALPSRVELGTLQYKTANMLANSPPLGDMLITILRTTFFDLTVNRRVTLFFFSNMNNITLPTIIRNNFHKIHYLRCKRGLRNPKTYQAFGNNNCDEQKITGAVFSEPNLPWR